MLIFGKIFASEFLGLIFLVRAGEILRYFGQVPAGKYLRPGCSKEPSLFRFKDK